MKNRVPVQTRLTSDSSSVTVQPVSTQHAYNQQYGLDKRPEAVVQHKLMEIANNSPHMLMQREQLESIIGEKRQGPGEAAIQAKSLLTPPMQPQQAPAFKSNNTGLPDKLKNGIEALSGLSLDNVKVHYNSSQPMQFNALAYAQGTDIHVAPGQERHVPHEAWHVVQQAQGRVKPTMQMRNEVPVNDNVELEKEADIMGAKSLDLGRLEAKAHLEYILPEKSHGGTRPVVQRALAIKGESADKAKALAQLNALAGDGVTLTGAASPWQVHIESNGTQGGKLLKNIIDNGRAFVWEISSDKPAQYDPSTYTIHMNVNAVSDKALPAKGEPEADYRMDGNQHIYLGHELNHALRHVTGHAKDRYKDGEGVSISDQWVKVKVTSGEQILDYYMQLEEAENIGLKDTHDTGAGAWAGTSENAFLREQGKAVRIGYFKKDSLENKLNRLDYLNSLPLTTPVRVAEYTAKKNALLGALQANLALDAATELVASEKEPIEKCTAKAKAAMKLGDDWHGHKTQNIEDKKSAAERTKNQAATAAETFSEEAEWDIWVDNNSASLGAEEDGYSADWNAINDPAEDSEAYNSAWYRQVRAINARRGQLDKDRTDTGKKFADYTTLMASASPEDFRNNVEVTALHRAILAEVEAQAATAESDLIEKVANVLTLMNQELAALKLAHMDKLAQITILENLVKTWQPVANYNAN
ncbi:MAG: eCIS core domain-containing protein [Methylobacter sp.]